MPNDPTILGNESAHFCKNNTNNNNELIKEKNKFLTDFQLKTPRLKVLVIGYLPIGWNWRVSLPSWQTQKGERGGGRGVKSKREQGNGAPSLFLQYRSPQSPLLFPSFLSPCHELVRIFTLSLEELCLKIVRECSVHLRMVSVPIYIWLLPKSSRWPVSSLLYWGG